MRFKVGQKVKVGNVYGGGNFDNGDIVTIEAIGCDDDPNCYKEQAGGDTMKELKPCCGTCAFFWGCGDWDLCCSLQVRRLCYEESEPCEKYKEAEE